jgi:hypothetical protein
VNLFGNSRRNLAILMNCHGLSINCPYLYNLATRESIRKGECIPRSGKGCTLNFPLELVQITPVQKMYCDDVLQGFVAGLVGRWQSSALKMETVCFSETFASKDESTRRQNPEVHHHPHRRESLRSYMCVLCLHSGRQIAYNTWSKYRLDIPLS